MTSKHENSSSNTRSKHSLFICSQIKIFLFAHISIFLFPVLVVVLSGRVHVSVALLRVGVVVVLLVVGWLRVVGRGGVLERGPWQSQRRLRRRELPLLGGRRARPAAGLVLARVRLQVRPGPLVAQRRRRAVRTSPRLRRQQVGVARLPPAEHK
jgi:hypothetical protein